MGSDTDCAVNFTFVVVEVCQDWNQCGVSVCVCVQLSQHAVYTETERKRSGHQLRRL